MKRLLTGVLTITTVFTALPASTVHAPAHEKSSYEPNAQEANGTVNAETMQGATLFLETFFKLYSTAT